MLFLSCPLHKSKEKNRNKRKEGLWKDKNYLGIESRSAIGNGWKGGTGVFVHHLASLTSYPFDSWASNFVSPKSHSPTRSRRLPEPRNPARIWQGFWYTAEGARKPHLLLLGSGPSSRFPHFLIEDSRSIHFDLGIRRIDSSQPGWTPWVFLPKRFPAAGDLCIYGRTMLEQEGHKAQPWLSCHAFCGQASLPKDRE